VLVVGVGAVLLAVPPVATVYHCNVCPGNAVAVNAVGVANWQYVIGLVTTGGTGLGLMVTVVVPAGEVQLLIVTVTLYVPEAAVVAAAMFGF